ncbi:SDR family NAD(P)-dependent oxidoreductase [Pseudonocardia sp. HH130630-07]|uniref:SDR family NAD(P)-dependent oxidoreductase n=1 Tax=Pseudonocardia sp. HH130630-07 TaxID=1690815 RepID=UPI0009F5AF37|nr:SDR family oxidoreductase [Pseudonocardia sp. HH130630-07]
MVRSHVVTGAGRGIGRAIAGRLLAGGDAVVVLDRDAPGWVRDHPAGTRVRAVTGSADDPAVAEAAADAARQLGTFGGWVNNAAVFRDAALDTDPPGAIVDLVTANLAPVLVGSSVAVRRFRDAGTAGSIVNVSSHQAQRAVRGALPYATAKAAIEGFTRAAAVDHGPQGIRVNAVALGSVTTERYEEFLAGQDAATAERTRHEMAEIHPLGRVGLPSEVAYLLSDAAGFVTGAVLPVDGGRAARGQDPEAR